MIDLETLSTASNAIIISIAAVKFSFTNDSIEAFSVNVDPKSCKQLGMVASPDTIAWWKNQRTDALKAFSKNQITIEDALNDLTNFVGVSNIKDTVFWCNGANFDFPILEWSCKACDREAPWKWWNLRDARTIYAISGLDMHNYPRVGTYHNAVDDCLTQINALKECLVPKDT